MVLELENGYKMEDQMFWLEILTFFCIDFKDCSIFDTLEEFPDFEYFPWILFPENVFPKISALFNIFCIFFFFSFKGER